MSRPSSYYKDCVSILHSEHGTASAMIILHTNS